MPEENQDNVAADTTAATTPPEQATTPVDQPVGATTPATDATAPVAADAAPSVPEQPTAAAVDPSTPTLTFGEKAVGLSFNPSGADEVANLKSIYAEAIDNLNTLRESTSDPEVKRLASIAITETQGAQMWAVKAATWKS